MVQKRYGFCPLRSLETEKSGKSETDQIIERLLEKLDNQPKTAEARILAKGVDRLPQEQREQALTVFRAVFANHADYFEKGTDSDDT